MKNVSFFLSVFALFILSFINVSCNKDNAVTTESEVVFAVNANRLKTSTEYELTDVVKAVFTIQTENSEATKYTMSEIKVFNFNGSFITEKIVLKTGIYKLTQFLLLDANGNAIFAAPVSGSKEAQNVDKPLEITFASEKNKTNPVEVSVLSTERKQPSDFGYNYFVIKKIKLINFMVGVVHSQTPEILSANLTVSSGSYVYTTNLESITNNIVSVRDGFESYTLTITKTGFSTYTQTFSKAELLEFENESDNLPLLISLEPNANETVTDIDGNVYTTVTIGSQVWMVENLKTMRYRNGDPITNVTDNTAWTSAGPAYSWYNNDASTHKETYGALYNFAAVADSRNIAPVGWHVPTDAEWSVLTEYLGGEYYAAGKLKESGTAHWIESYSYDTNETGFTALPGGYRSSNAGPFDLIGSRVYFWTSDEYGSGQAWARYFAFNSPTAHHYNYNKFNGFSVRCIKD